MKRIAIAFTLFNLLSLPPLRDANAAPTSELETTSAVAANIPSDLLNSVRIFERSGGRGGWLKTVSPFSLKGQVEYFYLMMSIPQQVDPDSPIILLKTKHTRSRFQNLLNSKAPVLLGNWIQGAGAAVLQNVPGLELKLVTDALRVSGAQTQSVVLLTRFTRTFELAHESRHLEDNENPDFYPPLLTGLGRIANAVQLSSNESQILVQAIIELRGHATQAFQAESDLASGLPYVNRGGAIEAGTPENLRFSYMFEANEAVNLYRNTYLSPLNQVVEKVKKKPEVFDELIKLFSQYDFSNDREHKLEIKRLLRVQ
jgi:hypothetical protein